MKYSIPTIKITSFLEENVATGASVNVKPVYEQEVKTLFDTVSIAGRSESIKGIFEFKTE